MSEPADLGVRVVTDADVLRALAGPGPGPLFAAELGQRLGMPENAVPVRLASLVSLGYVEQLMEGKAGGYTITERGLEELRRLQMRRARGQWPDEPMPADRDTTTDARDRR